jgi:hypothetical protein
MTPPVRMSEGPSASRIDDLGSAHIPVSPETRLFEATDSPAQLALVVVPLTADLQSQVAMR